MNRSEITPRLAARLKAARAERGLSLDAIAELSGVSRSMVSQIERGTSSPTVATLWNLTQALGVDFAGLLDADDSSQVGIEVLNASATPTIDSHGTGCRIRILSPPGAAGNNEVYELCFDVGGALESEAHETGAREHLTVFEGTLQVQSGEASRTIATGDTARYAADLEHSICAKDGPARAFLVVQYNG